MGDSAARGRLDWPMLVPQAIFVAAAVAFVLTLILWLARSV